MIFNALQRRITNLLTRQKIQQGTVRENYVEEPVLVEQPRRRQLELAWSHSEKK